MFAGAVKSTIIIITIFYCWRVFHTSVSRWSFTGVWETIIIITEIKGFKEFVKNYLWYQDLYKDIFPGCFFRRREIKLAN